MAHCQTFLLTGSSLSQLIIIKYYNQLREGKPYKKTRNTRVFQVIHSVISFNYLLREKQFIFSLKFPPTNFNYIIFVIFHQPLLLFFVFDDIIYYINITCNKLITPTLYKRVIVSIIVLFHLNNSRIEIEIQDKIRH